jgi:hypothetical protein
MVEDGLAGRDIGGMGQKRRGNNRGGQPDTSKTASGTPSETHYTAPRKHGRR